jgi:hypothetical protein
MIKSIKGLIGFVFLAKGIFNNHNLTVVKKVKRASKSI